MAEDKSSKDVGNSTQLTEAVVKKGEGQQLDALKKMTELAKAQNVVSPRPYKMSGKEISTQEQQNHFRSAGVFMESLAREAQEWKECVGEGFAPAIIAILYGGVQINVNTLSQVSFHGIRIEGLMNGAPCTVLAHQSTVQMLCHAIKLEPEIPARPIGFIWEGNEVEV